MAALLWLDASQVHAAAPCPTAAWKKTLATTPKRVASVEARATDLARLSEQAPSERCRVALFEAYWQFYRAVRESLTDELLRLDETSPRRDAITKEVKTIGWVVKDVEEGVYVAESDDWLLEHAGQHLPPAWQRYLALLLAETREGFVTDESFEISLRELRLRLRAWEDFLAAYPRFERREGIIGQNRVYLIALLMGVDNQPSFENGKLRAEVRTEIEAYFRDPKAAERRVVKQYHQLLKATRFRDQDAAEAFLTEQKLTWLTLR